MFCWRGVSPGNGLRRVSRYPSTVQVGIVEDYKLHCIYCTLDAYTLSVLMNNIYKIYYTTHMHTDPGYSSSFDFLLEDLNHDPNLLPFSPPSFSFCNLSASFAFFNASLACALSEELEKNEANPTQIDKPPMGDPWGSSIRSAIKAKFRASLWASAYSRRKVRDI